MNGSATMVFLDAVNRYLNKTRSFKIAAMLLVESGLQDVAVTLDSISKYGIECEGNLFLRKIMEHWGVENGLLIPKILSSGIIIYTAYKMNKMSYKFKGEYLLYGASIYWLCGAIAHLFLGLELI
jgi:hypothetical protein